MTFRQITTVTQEIFSEAGRALSAPCKRVAACGVMTNPHAGKPAIDDFSGLVELSLKAGEAQAQRAVLHLERGRLSKAFRRLAGPGPARLRWLRRSLEL